MIDRSKSSSSILTWLILGTITAIIIGTTVLLSYAGNPKECNCLPSGWKTIRPPKFVLALAQQDQYIWAGGPEGLTRIDRFTGELAGLPVDNIPHISYVNDILVDSRNVVWIAHWDGLTSLVNGKWMTYGMESGLPAGPVRSLLQDRSGLLWAGTDNGVVYFDGMQWHPLSRPDGQVFNEISMIYQDKDNLLWFASSSLSKGGLSSYDGKTWRMYTVKNGLAHICVNSILQDSHGTIWVGTGFGKTGGANKILNGQISSKLTKEDGLAGEKVRSIFEDSAGNIWFGSEYDGVGIYRNGNWLTLTPAKGLAGWEVLEIIQDSDGVLWIATENGISRIQSASHAFLIR